MRAAVAARSSSSARGTVAAAGAPAGINQLREKEDDGMMSSLADLIDNTETLDGKSENRNDLRGAFSPKRELLDGLKSVQDEFHDHLGSEWFAVSSSNDGSDNSSHGPEMGSARASWGTGTEISGGGSHSSFGSSDNSAGNSNNNVAAANKCTQPQPQRHGCAAHMAEISAKLNKLDHKALLTYAARITILVGNFYRIAREQADGAQSPQSEYISAGRSAASVMQAASEHEHNWRSGSSSSQAALIELAGGASRPLSSMTTYSDIGNMQFSASTQSLAFLPTPGNTVHAHVDGDIDDGTKTINDYVIVAPIGAGSFGTVELGVTLSGEPRAIKAVKRSTLLGKNESAVRREIAIMKKLRHDNVVRLFEVIDDPGQNMIYLVMKYASNGPIVKVRPDFTCDSIPLTMARTLLRQLISGLHYLHLRRVVHRDIKPDNILLDHANVPIFIDFGVSGTVHKRSRTAVNDKSTEGTPAFWAPEVFARKLQADEQYKKSSNNITIHASSNSNNLVHMMPLPPLDLMAADVYSLGATFYTAVCGIVPFIGKNQEEMGHAVMHDPLNLPDFLTPQWKDLFVKILEKDPTRRIKLPALKVHPVFTEDGQDPGSPKDDLHVTDKEISDSIKTIRRADPHIVGSDPNVLANFGGPKTPRHDVPSGGGNQAASSKAMFHRKLPPVRKVAASPGSPVAAGLAAGGKMPVVSMSMPNNFSLPVGHASAAVVTSSSGNNPPPLPRSMSTSRMPLRNLVKASDVGSSSSASPDKDINKSNGSKLPPLQNPQSLSSRRPSSTTGIVGK